MSKTKNWLMDMEEEFYAIADREIGSCENLGEFKDIMAEHKDKIAWTLEDGEDFDFMLGEMWHEKWSKYA